MQSDRVAASLNFASTLLDKDVDKGKITREAANAAKEALKPSTDMKAVTTRAWPSLSAHGIRSLLRCLRVLSGLACEC
jgi:hypothetical protein